MTYLETYSTKTVHQKLKKARMRTQLYTKKKTNSHAEDKTRVYWHIIRVSVNRFKEKLEVDTKISTL
jgi:hypothetical protein